MDWEQYLVDALSDNPIGAVVLVIVAAIVLGVKGYDKLHTMSVQRKAEKKAAEDEKKKLEKSQLEELIAQKEFRAKIDGVISQFPDTTAQIQELAGNLSEIIARVDDLSKEKAEMTMQFMESTKKINDDIKEIRKSIGTISEVSNATDKQLSESMAVMKTALEKVGEKVDVIIKGDTDEFRVYIMHAYNEHVLGKQPLTREDALTLRIRYIKYRREKGNGWAESFYKAMLGCKTTEDDLTVRELLQKEIGEADEFHLGDADNG